MSTSSGTRHVRVDVSVTSVVLALFAIGLAIEAAFLVTSARRILSWVIACAVVAALIELAVQWLTNWVRRPIAIVLVLLTIAASAGFLVFGVFHDLDREVNRLQALAPVAAHDIEQSKRFGNIATELHFQERVQDAVDRLKEPSSGLAGRAVSSLGSYFVCAILTILFLSWGPKLARGALGQLSETRRHHTERIFDFAFSRARQYVSLALLQATCIGFATFVACLWADLPAAIPLALALAVMSLIPAIGVMIGAVPILILSGGLLGAGTTLALAGFFLLVQVGSNYSIQPQIERAADLYVGPGIIVIAFLAGFELYGIGGAMYAAALCVMGTAVIDGATEILREESSETDLRVRASDQRPADNGQPT